MPLAEATAVLQMRSAERRSAFHLEPHDPLADWLALEQLAEWCQRFSPTVGIEPSPRPDTLLLDISGLAPLFGGEEALADEALDAFSGRGLLVRIALAGTIGAAWARAHFAENADCGLRIAEGEESSKCGVRSSEFGVRGQGTNSASRNPQSAFSSLPIAALRLPEETVVTLAGLGLRRIGQVAALPREMLSSRFGPELLRRLDQASGKLPEVIVSHRPPPEFVASWPFETPCERREALELALKSLVQQLAGRLAPRREGALELHCRLECPDEPVPLTLGLFRPSASADHLWDLLRLRLESVRLSGPVSSLRLEIVSTAPLEFQQQELFLPDRWREAPRHLAGLVDRLSSRLGRAAVLRPVVMSDAQPEFACVYLPWTGRLVRSPTTGRGRESFLPADRVSYRPSVSSRQKRLPTPSRSRRTKRSEPHHAPYFSPGRPLCLHPPMPLEVALSASGADAGSFGHGTPVQFCLADRRYRVRRSWGPERIETGWWRTGLVRRDYYLVETADATRYWIFHQLSTGQWFLQGEFE
jgi:protein ImuB